MPSIGEPMNELQTDANALRQAMQLVPPREPGEKLRPGDEAKILELHAGGHTQTDIARAVGCHQSTVSRTLAEYDDSRPLARKYLEAKALDIDEAPSDRREAGDDSAGARET
jgi:hypothetical protein